MSDIDEMKIRRLDFSLLLVFRELLARRRTTEVAQRLGLSQSAISHALARLRELTGDPLFLRRPDGLTPTASALALGPQVEALLAGGRALLGARERFEPALTQRRFRLGANDFVSAVLGPRLRDALAREAPGALFTVRFFVGAEALAALERDGVDLAIGRFPDAAHTESIGVRRLGGEPYVVVARADHPAILSGLDLAGYCALDHVLVSFRGGFRGAVDTALERLGARRRVAASVPTFLTALAMVAESEMVATLPVRLASLYAKRFGLVTRAPPFELEPFETLMLRHERTRGDAGLSWLESTIARLWPETP